jgi:hypothetical protein
MYQRLLWSTKSDMDMSWLCLQGIPEEEDDVKNSVGSNRGKGRWLRKTQKSTRSKTATWGPTHSLSSDEVDDSPSKSNALYEEEKKTEIDVNKNFNTPPSKPTTGINSNNNSQDTASTKSSHESTPLMSDGRAEPVVTIQSTLGRVWDNLQCLEDTTTKSTNDHESENKVMDLFESVCSPCKPKNLGDSFSVNCEDTPLGIARLAPPNNCI